MPTISIGLPVYNGQKTLELAIRCLIEQTYSDFEVIISDNHSTDDTALISRRFTEQDDRLRYIKHAENMGVGANLQFTLQEATGEYFLWNAHDDTRSNTFLEKNIAFLEENQNFVGCTSPHCFQGEEPNTTTWQRFSLEGETYDRLQEFMSNRWKSHSILFALFRTAALKKALLSLPRKHPFAADWLIIIHLLLQGPIKRIDEGLFVSGRGGASESPGRISNFQYNLFDYLFPLCRFGLFSFPGILRSSKLTAYDKVRLIYRLIQVNWQFRLKSG